MSSLGAVPQNEPRVVLVVETKVNMTKNEKMKDNKSNNIIISTKTVLYHHLLITIYSYAKKNNTRSFSLI